MVTFHATRDIRCVNLHRLFLELIAPIALMAYLTTKHVRLIGWQLDGNSTAPLEHHLYLYCVLCNETTCKHTTPQLYIHTIFNHTTNCNDYPKRVVCVC